MEENLDDIAGVVRPPVALSGTRGHGGGNYGWSVVMTLAWGGGPRVVRTCWLRGWKNDKDVKGGRVTPLGGYG